MQLDDARTNWFRSSVFTRKSEEIERVKRMREWREWESDENERVMTDSQWWLSHSYEVCVHMNESHVINESCESYESWVMCTVCMWVMSQIRMSHVTHMNESCHRYGWIMSHVHRMHESYVIRESCESNASCIPNTLQNTATHCNTSWISVCCIHGSQDSWVTWVLFLMSHVITKRQWRERERILHNHDTFHSTCYIPETHHIDELRSLGISRYKCKLRFWLNLNLYREIWVFRFGGFRGCGIFSGIL